MLATVATHQTPSTILLRVSVTIFRDVFLQRLSVTLLVVVAACDSTSRLDDTLGVQSSARWEWHGRITVTEDPQLTITRLAIGTAVVMSGSPATTSIPPKARETSTR